MENNICNSSFILEDLPKTDLKTVNLIQQIKQKERDRLERKINEQKLKKRDSKYGQCKVCDDIASGIHYGIPVCDGCKGFFVRSLTKYKSYFCFKNQNCGIGKERRKSCKYCRFKLCLAAGMSLEAIKLGRKPLNKSKKDKSGNEKNDVNTNIDYIENSLSLTGNENYDFSALNFSTNSINNFEMFKKTYNNLFYFRESNIVATTKFTEQYLHSNEEDIIVLCTLLKDKAYQLYSNYLRINENILDTAIKLSETIGKSTEEPKKFPGWDSNTEDVWNSQLRGLFKHTKSLFSYATELPGFNKISYEDFSLAINERVFYIYGVRHNRLIIDNECYITEEGIQFSKHWIYQILKKEYAEKVFEFHRRFRDLQLTQTEIALIVPIVLTTPNVEYSRLKDAALLKSINQYYNKALLYEFSLNKRSEQFVTGFIEILDYFDTLQKEIRSFI